VIRGGQPIARESGLRYLRHRANRRLRKARLRRTLGRFSMLALAQLALAGVLVLAGARAFLLVTGASEFDLVRIEIEGAARADEGAIRDRLAPLLGHSILDLRLAEVVTTTLRDPWVREASARRLFPGTLRIRITERKPRALALIGGVSHVVDGTGFVIQPSGPGAADDLVVLTGLDDLADQALIDALRRGAAIVERLEQAAPAWVGEISEIDLSQEERVVVRTADPGPSIFLDPERAERNLTAYLELRRELTRRIEAVDYVDLRWQDHITLMPFPGETEEDEEES
jgi:cell division protein FtsQ